MSITAEQNQRSTWMSKTNRVFHALSTSCQQAIFNADICLKEISTIDNNNVNYHKISSLDKRLYVDKTNTAENYMFIALGSMAAINWGN